MSCQLSPDGNILSQNPLLDLSHSAIRLGIGLQNMQKRLGRTC